MKIGEWILLKCPWPGKMEDGPVFYYKVVLKKIFKDYVLFNISIQSDPKETPFAVYNKKVENKNQITARAVLPHLEDILLDSTYDALPAGHHRKIRIKKKTYHCRVMAGQIGRVGEVENFFFNEAPFNFPLKAAVKDKDKFERTLLILEDYGNESLAKVQNLKIGKNKHFFPQAEKKILNEELFLNYYQSLIRFDNSPAGRLKDLFLEAASQRTVDLKKLLENCLKTDILYIGEIHDHKECHLFQYRLIEKLLETESRIVLGLEMFYRSSDIQQGLDDFIAGRLSEAEFRKKIYSPCWNGAWYGLYRNIFLLARDRQIRMIGLNCPKNLMRDFKENPQALTPLMKSWFASDVDFNDKKHREITLWGFQGMLKMGMDVESLYAGQCIWDDTMSESIFQFRKGHPDHKMIVIAGEMHVSYKISIPGKTERRAKKAGIRLTSKTFVPIAQRKFSFSGFHEFMNSEVADYAYFIQDNNGPDVSSRDLREENWEKGYFLFIEGKISEAEAVLANDDSDMAQRVYEKIRIFAKAKELTSEGEFQKAKDLIMEIDSVYKGAKEIWLKKIIKAEKEGKWDDAEP